MIHPSINVSHEEIEAFCRRWKVVELALFGSAVREDFGPESDIDVLVDFAPGCKPSLFGMVDMRDELVEMFGGRKVDLVTRDGLNKHRAPYILRSLEALYAA